MKIDFDDSLKIAGIGMVPWSRLGPERWFPNYKIASFVDWDIEDSIGPDVFALSDFSPEAQLSKANTKALLADDSFQKMLAEQLPGHQFTTYKPVNDRHGLPVLTNDAGLARKLENKAEFREMLHGEGVPFPDYRICSTEEFREIPLADLLQGKSSIIVQDSVLSGGKGTFVVSDEATRDTALATLTRLGSTGTLVVSTRIEDARERSVQCVVTKYGVFVGPLQAQIIDDPLLGNPTVSGSSKFCGAQISPDDSLRAIQPEIVRYAQLIGKQAQALGYKGIFGLDCLVDAAGKVYVLEMNARLTGVTPLLTMLYRDGQDIPFYLLHLLELSGAEYAIGDMSVAARGPVGSLMIVHAQGGMKQNLRTSLKSGLYDANTDGNTLEFLSQQLYFEAATPQLLLQRYASLGPVKPSARLLTVFSNQAVLSDDEKLSAESEQAIRQIRSRLVLQ